MFKSVSLCIALLPILRFGLGAGLNVAVNSCACYTETVCPPVTHTPTGCTTANCIYWATATVPPSNKKCTSTPTKTAFTSGCSTEATTCPPATCRTSTYTETGCFTATTTVSAKKCSTTCANPVNCIVESTTTVPPKLCGCPKTKTITEKYPCTCTVGCPTHTVTVTGSPWGSASKFKALSLASIGLLET